MTRPSEPWPTSPPGTGACPGRDAGPPDPEDVPVLRPPWLDELAALAGEWETEARWPGGERAAVRGITTFEWLTGKFYVLQRFSGQSPAPDGVAIIGARAGGTFTQRYFDSRGVHRVYAMSLRGRVWRLWRDAPGFWQRYAGALDQAGTTIDGTWEYSKDGVTWMHDCDLTYRRLS
jgi:hypothetical protein